MNKERRKAISEIIEKIGDIQNLIESVKDDEQDYYDNMPESFQSGEKGENAQNAIVNLESAIDALEGCASDLDSASE